MISFVLAYFAIILLIAALLAAIGLDPDRHLGLHHRRGQRGPGHGAVIGPSTNFASLPDRPSGYCRSACCWDGSRS
jgi:trk system potassium uptake protein TrkH